MTCIYKRRYIQFKREPRLWILIASPFITAIISFLIINNLVDYSQDEQMKQVGLILLNGILFSMWLLVGFATGSGIFIVGLVQDREFKLRYMMNFIGLRTFPYFIGNFLLDFSLFMIPTSAFILLLFPMQIMVFTSKWGSILLVMMCFGAALISLTYMISFMFSNSQKAFRLLGTIYIIIGFAFPITISSVLVTSKQSAFTNFVSLLLYMDPFYQFYQTLIFIVIKSYFGSLP